MERKELNLSPADGQVTYHVNGRADIAFNPTDAAFAQRVYDAFNKLADLYERRKGSVGGDKDVEAVFAQLSQLDAETRALIDEALGEGLCEKVFGDMNVVALADGLPVCLNLMLAVMDEIDESIARELELTNPRIAKYSAKYKKK